MFSYDGDFLIGPATIAIDGTNIGPTLEGTDPVLSIEPITEEVKTDDDSDVKHAEQTGEKVTFNGVIPYTAENASVLGLSGTNMTLHRIDPMTIISKNLTVTLYNASIKLTVKKKYAATAVNIIEIEVTALPDVSGNKYNFDITS